MNMKLSPHSFFSAAASAALAVAVPAALIAPNVAAAQSQSDLTSAVTALRAISTMRADFVQADQIGRASCRERVYSSV